MSGRIRVANGEVMSTSPVWIVRGFWVGMSLGRFPQVLHMQPIRQLPLLSLVIFMSLALAPAALGAPSITGLTPATAPVDALVTIAGTNFGATQGTSTVTFNGTVATVIVGWSDTSIVATVPSGAITGNVVVTVGGVGSNGKSFTVGIDIDIKRVVAFGSPDPGRTQISKVTVWVNFPPGTASVGLKFTSPDTFASPANKVWTKTLTPGMPHDTSCLLDPTAVACHDFPVPTLLTQGANPICPSACFDNITIIPHPTGTAGALQFEITFLLQSNYNVGPGTTSTLCSSTQNIDPEHYTIEVTTGTPLTGACVESYNKSTATSCLANANFNLLPANEVFVQGFPKPTVQCGKTSRPAVDVVMVLDRSGSMSTQLTPPPGAFCSGQVDRIGALRCSARRFLDLWDPLTVDPSNPPLRISGDNVGVVSFSSAATSPPDQALTPVVPGNGAVQTVLTNISPGGSTSIGDGLRVANQMLGTANRQAILLMTDGQQNTDPKVEVTNLATRTAALYCDTAANCAGLPTTGTCNYTSGNPCPLPNNAQIYTVTLGPSLGVSAAVDQAISDASLGFYLHTDTDGGLLSPFFLELLQNFLKFNSPETVRLISDRVSGTPFSTEVPISTTSRDAEFSLMWPKDLGALRITVTPPGGAPAIVKGDTSGFIVIIRSLPLPPSFDPIGNWHIDVKAIDLAPGITTAGTNAAGIPFDLHIMTDDAGVKSELSVVPGDYKTGDNIRLQAKLRYFGLPILGLGSRPGDKIFVSLIAPGQGVGDMLSDSTASSTPPRPDIDPGAEAKLFNAVQNAPLRVVRPPDITLFDDGRPEHGDDVAGDGIYSALHPGTIPGDYNFVFSVERTDPNSIRFSRQQLRTAFVRAVPDAGNTVFQSSIVRGDRTNTLSIVMTPRVKPGPGCLQADPKCGRMGPGWANYFWFTAPGQTPFKAVDNLNGTYTATLAFTGSNPPPVSVHFENVLAVIGDSVTPDHLPAPLGPGNVFTDVPPPTGRGKFAVFFDAGAGIPHGTFGNFFNTGFSLNAGLEYIATSHFSAEGIFGYHHFPGTITGDLNLYQFSVKGEAYLTSGTLRPFVNGGIGAYKFSPGPTKFGGNVGAGLLYSLTSRVGLEGAYNFHAINTAGGVTEYSSFQGGIRFVIKP